MSSNTEGRAMYFLVKDGLKRDQYDWKRVLGLIKEKRYDEAEAECKLALERIDSSLCK